MTSFLLRYIGADRLPRSLSDFDVEQFFCLPKESLESIRDRFRTDRWVGVGIQLAFLRATGRPLDRFSLVPPALLRYLSQALKVAAPTIASLRAIYKRRPTLYEHQRWAREHLGLTDVAPDTITELTKVLSAQAAGAASVDELVGDAARWLYEHKVLIPADRTLRDAARDAFSVVERESIAAIQAAIPRDQLKACRDAVFAKREGPGNTVLEWLKTSPKRHSPSSLNETLKKIRFLRQLGVDTWDLRGITIARQRAYAQSVVNRPPAESKRRKDVTQILEIVCFLHITLLEFTDIGLYQAGRRIGDLVRHGYEKSGERRARKAVTYREQLITIKALVDDETQTAEARLDGIKQAFDAIDLSPSASHAAGMREALTAEPRRVRVLLRALSDLQFQGNPTEPAIKQLTLVRELHDQGATELPEGVDVGASGVWKPLIEGEDRKNALRALEACAAMGLRSGLRRGSVSVPHSLSFRERDQMLIAPEIWKKERERHLSLMGVPDTANTFLDPLIEHIREGVLAVAKAHEDGKVSIDAAGMLHLTALEALPEDPEPQRLLNLMFGEIGQVQLPDLLLEVDAATHFSEVLLGRLARDEHELVAIYAAIVAQASDTDARTMAAMTPQLDPGDVSTAMRALETPGRLRKGNERVFEFQRSHAIAELWGSGKTASSDMMSLDASKHLWSARIDPRRRTPAAGVYTHVLDSHGIVYDQPIVLNERQAGPAIEGAVRYNNSSERVRLELLAVDTHGYTYPGMAFAKVLGFDLCPALRDLSERKLFVPRSFDMSASLGGLIVRDVSLRAIHNGWDEFLRWGASVYSGRLSANVAMQRMGSAARGDPVHRAADQLGRLLRTLFLCDYFTKPMFRREIRTVLNRGESVHQLQRVIHSGKIAPARGRRRDEMVAISGAHALLTNIVLAWNTHKMQEVVDQWRRTNRPIDDLWIRRMGPAHYSNINFRGLFRYGIDRYREELLQSAQIRKRA